MSYIDENGVIKNAVIQFKRRTTNSDVDSALSSSDIGTPVIKSTNDATQSKTEGLVIKTASGNNICLPNVKVKKPVCRVINIPEPVNKSANTYQYKQIVLKYFDVDLKYCDISTNPISSNGSTVTFTFKLMSFPGLTWDDGTIEDYTITRTNIIQVVFEQLYGNVNNSNIKDYIHCPNDRNSYTATLGNDNLLTIKINNDYFGKFANSGSSIVVSTINNAYIINSSTPSSTQFGNYKPFWIKPAQEQTPLQLKYYDGNSWQTIQTGGGGSSSPQQIFFKGDQEPSIDLSDYGNDYHNVPLWVNTSDSSFVLYFYNQVDANTYEWQRLDSVWGTSSST